MLQEATKILNSAFHDSFIKKLSLYLHDCVREEVKSSTFRNLKQDKDNKWIFLKTELTTEENNEFSILSNEKMFTEFPEPLKLDGSDSYLTELMIQTELGQKDKYLIYGYLFLVGKNGRSKKYNEFLTPLLYAPCKLERNGMNIDCNLQDEVLSLNTAAIATLMNKNNQDEDEMEQMLDGLLDVVPSLPLKEDELKIFLTTLKSLVPDLEFDLDNFDDISENNIESNSSSGESSEKMVNYDNLEEALEEAEKPKIQPKIDKVVLTNQSAIILTKRPVVTAGVLHELTQIAETPSGIFRESVLGVINDEYLQGKGKFTEKIKKEKSLSDFVPITPLSLSDSQEDVIKKITENPLVAVYGPPGTGKSQTIVNLVAHLIANGKTVLVASRMDKATDVIAERLNALGAPYLALRAGRLNYQKQLSFELQDLISNKVDLDTGFENSILLDVKDMQNLVNSIKTLETKCEKIIEYEEQWQILIKQYDEKLKYIGGLKIVPQKLDKSEVSELENVINKLEKNYEKHNFFADLSNKIDLYHLRKILNLNDFHLNSENIERMKIELEIAKLSAEARYYENLIFKTGNLHNMLEEIKQLRKKQKTLATEILRGKRRESLKGLLRDQVKRQRLIIHTKALVERKQNLQNKLLEEEDFRPLLEAFPCWCVTTYAISGSIPMKSGLFDVVIIDEASQCDIASCFPVLFRAKKAVIVGDDKQLPHLSFLEKAKEQSFLSQYEIPSKYQLMWRFRTNSMFDLANYYSTSPVLLDEHFRSLYPIIQFSNNEFYGDRMRIMTQCRDKNVLELNIVPDGKVDVETTRNMPETEMIIQKIQDIIKDDEENQKSGNQPVSIGIISPFRGQVELIKKALSQIFSETIIRKHCIEVGTAHTFQGDERDIMIISWAVADNSYGQSLTFLQKPNLFNVAITRARKKQIVFLSKKPQSLPQGLLKDYIEYIQAYETRNSLADSIEIDENIYKNNFEKEVANALREEGYSVTAGIEIAGFSTDLTVVSPEGLTVIVECDGVSDNSKTKINQIKKHTILERAGLNILRISYRDWYHSSLGCIERVKIAFSDIM